MKNEHKPVTATDFTNIKPGVIRFDSVCDNAADELIDLSDCKRKARIREFQETFHANLEQGIAEWLIEHMNIRRSVSGVVQALDIDAVNFDDIVDSIIMQLDAEPSVFSANSEEYSFTGGCTFESPYNPDEEGMILDQCPEHGDGMLFSNKRLEVTVVANDVTRMHEATVYVTCSPFIARRQDSSSIPTGCLDLSMPYSGGDLCYALPPWFFGKRKELTEECFVITKFDTLMRRHRKYLAHQEAVQKILDKYLHLQFAQQCESLTQKRRTKSATVKANFKPT